jgi:hypothetical protein
MDDEILCRLQAIEKAISKQGQLVKYQVNIAVIGSAQPIIANCAEVTFLNIGDAVATVNNLPLQTGEQLIINGNERELDITSYFINFQGAGSQSCAVLRKIYVDGN